LFKWPSLLNIFFSGGAAQDFSNSYDIPIFKHKLGFAAHSALLHDLNELGSA